MEQTQPAQRAYHSTEPAQATRPCNQGVQAAIPHGACRIQMSPGGINQLAVGDVGGADPFAGAAIQATVQMAGGDRVGLELTAGEALHQSNAPAR